MERVVFRPADGAVEWIDVTAPTREELQAIAGRFGLHAMSVEDCLDPWHPPKYERFDDTTFVIVRAFDREAGPLASSVQALTRKVAIFVRPGLVLTIHRVPMAIVSEVEQRAAAGTVEGSSIGLLGALVNASLDSFGPPLETVEETLDRCEEALFTATREPPPMLDLYVLKRRVNILNRLIRQTSIVIQRMVPPSERSGPLFHDLRENAESYHFYAEHLLDAINNLLGIHVALASHRANEVMRILTVFSAFFLPLTFIVGVYGMNFRHMPELDPWWGYPAILLVMGVVSLAIGRWFWRRGWLGWRAGR